MVQNSSFSYRQLCGDNGLMVIVPHEDDEINLAGALIYGARKEGVPVKCVFITMVTQNILLQYDFVKLYSH